MRFPHCVQWVPKYLDGSRRTTFRLALAAVTMSLAAAVCVGPSQDRPREIGKSSRSLKTSAKMVPAMPATTAPAAASSPERTKAKESQRPLSRPWQGL
jgi:hypothetical protein